ncbi:MAG: porin family protein [Gammaproteobacteria bacterium]|nr:porin family protein [Gammaproteobacteria bacterium]MBI5617544.1 porin family protein [Gammaproteobacteria bacterium]
MGGASYPLARERTSFDDGYYIGTATGRQVADHVRFEGEYSCRHNDLERFSLHDDGGLGAAPGGADLSGARFDSRGSMDAFAVMANGYFDFDLLGFKPYFGSGLGYANVKMNDTRTLGLQSLNALAPADSIGLSDVSDDVFAYQFGAGVGYQIRPGIVASVDYRYFGTQDPQFKPVTGELLRPEYNDYDLGLNVRFDF